MGLLKEVERLGLMLDTWQRVICYAVGMACGQSSTCSSEN